MKKDIFLEKIKSKRKQKGFKQEQIAALLGITQSSYSKLESGTHEVSFTTIRKLCKILDIEINIKISDIYIIEK